MLMLKQALRALLLLLAIVSLTLLINVMRVPNLQPAPGTSVALTVDANQVADRLAQLLRIRSISSAPDQQPFHDLAAQMKALWPDVYRQLTLVHLNGHSQVLMWHGKNSALKPLLLLAHLDVVPATGQQWQHDAFSGAIIDGEIWGRGAIDNKGSVAAILEAVSALQASGFTPTRTVIIALGHDEEVGGFEGAKQIADWLHQSGVTPWLVLDEGGFVLSNSPLPIDKPVALIGVAEKGYLSVKLTAFGLSGHSSMPPKDLAVFALARALNRIEAAPFEMSTGGPTGATFDWLNSEMRWPEKLLFSNRWLFEPLIMRALSSTPSAAALLHTTQAPTMLDAGIKDNVLPETASATINFRVHPRDSGESILEHLRTVIDDPAIEIEALNRFDSNAQQASDWHSPAFQTLTEVVRTSFPDAHVAPYLMLGATDARYYRPLTDQVYRFLPFRLDNSELTRLHGRDERVAISSYVEAIGFYANLIARSSETVDE